MMRLWQDERGQSVVTTFPLLMLFLVLVLGVAAFVVKVRPAQVAVGSAARVCARHAAATLNPELGYQQAATAALETLHARHLSSTQAEITVTPLGTWDRFSQVACTVRYEVDLSRVPLLHLFANSDSQTLEATYILTIEPFKSRWGDTG